MPRKARGLEATVETETSEPRGKKGGLVGKVEKSRTRRKSYTIDLRIHSPGSLGHLGIDGIDTAPALVRLAKVKGIDVIGITDLYSGEFIDEVLEAAKDSPLTVIPGVDLRCRVGNCDDVIISCFLPEGSSSENISHFLQKLDIPANANRRINYLVEAPLRSIVDTLESAEGFAIPSRIDKTPQRLAAIPTLVEEFGFQAFEVAYLTDTAAFFKRRWPRRKFQLFSFSNANALAQVGSRIAKVKMPIPGFNGVKELVERLPQA